jgi:peptide/nickel transport system permease protein
MTLFFLRRLLSGVLLLLVISTITFVLLYSSGRNVARTLLGDYASQEQVDQRAAELGIDSPLIEQFLDWFGHALRFDFGRSWFTSEPVVSAVVGRLPITLTLVVIVIALTAILSVLLGVTAARRRGAIDRLVQVLAIVGYAVPAFIVGVVLVTLFAVNTRLLPATGFVPFTDDPRAWAASLVLPVAALLLGTVAATAQQVRSSVIDVLRQDYVRTLRSRGLPENEIIFRHVLRAAAPPGLTVLALQFVGLLSGTVVVEQIFALPGIGFLVVQSTTRGDLPVVLGVVVFTVLMVILVNLVIDLVIGWLNPKVRLT